MGIYAMTGGATGIGAAIKQQLRDEGHQVIVVDVKDADIIADLSTAEGRQAAIDGIKERAPDGLDGFVPCAGLGPHVSPKSLISRVNYFGAKVLIEGLLDLLIQRRGSVVVISSNSASMPGYDQQHIDLLLADDEEAAAALVDPLPGQQAYGGSKCALTRWMRRHAAEYAAKGVRMNAVAPGIIRTPLSDAATDDAEFGQAMREFSASVPVGFKGEPKDIAAPVCFLFKPEARFFCGSVIFVDGGHDAMLRPDQF